MPEKIFKSVTKNKSENTLIPLGTSINVFIRTINTVNEEYLVDFTHLDNELAKYGIFEASKETL